MYRISNVHCSNSSTSLPMCTLTSSLFHWKPPLNGLWCSWISPMAWPNSCRTVARSTNPRFIVNDSRGSLVASVPMYDQDPPERMKYDWFKSYSIRNFTQFLLAINSPTGPTLSQHLVLQEKTVTWQSCDSHALYRRHPTLILLKSFNLIGQKNTMPFGYQHCCF